MSDVLSRPVGGGRLAADDEEARHVAHLVLDLRARDLADRRAAPPAPTPPPPPPDRPWRAAPPAPSRPPRSAPRSAGSRDSQLPALRQRLRMRVDLLDAVERARAREQAVAHRASRSRRVMHSSESMKHVERRVDHALGRVLDGHDAEIGHALLDLGEHARDGRRRHVARRQPEARARRHVRERRLGPEERHAQRMLERLRQAEMISLKTGAQRLRRKRPLFACCRRSRICRSRSGT